MYISTWVLILAVVIILLYFKWRKSKEHIKEGLEENNISPEGNWKGAEMYKKYVLEKSPNLEDYLQDERDMIKAMEADMLRLRERYKYDSKKQIEIAQDWYDFAKAVYEVKSSREMLDVDMGDNGFEAHGNRTKEPYTIIQEVTKRVEMLLGNESAMKAVRERIESTEPKQIGDIIKEAMGKNKKK